MEILLLPAGMVLVRTETGQLVMIPQQVLAQAQAKLQQGQTVANIAQRPATPTATTAIRVSTATTVGLPSHPTFRTVAFGIRPGHILGLRSVASNIHSSANSCSHEADEWGQINSC